MNDFARLRLLNQQIAASNMQTAQVVVRCRHRTIDAAAQRYGEFPGLMVE
jgi:hypothetical protein